MRQGQNRDRARQLRNDLTEAEQRLWRELRSRRFAGWKFRRQVPIGPYIADFACVERKLVLELDGSQHAESQRDEARAFCFRTSVGASSDSGTTSFSRIGTAFFPPFSRP